MGIDLLAGELGDAADRLVDEARAGDGGYVCLCNVHVLVSAQRNRALRSALREAKFVFADGQPVAWLQRRHGVATAARVAGPDLMSEVLDRGRDFGLRHFLYGSTPDVVDGLAERLAEEHPGLELAGAIAPPFGIERADEIADLARIRATRPDVVWCALGAPKQELWMHRAARALSPALVIGVGAAFDFLAESKTRAPEWMQRSGLEWFHRLASEPRRLAGRYVRTNSEFVVRAGFELARGALRA
jgi:N-acetylglucosaminyldiphosphoundecaprenol N-acetyl-beta-D-mannosaminyltransferase